MKGQFKSNIPMLIKSSGLSIRGLNQQIGINRSTLTLLNHGHFPQRNAEEILLALCIFFNCQLSDLFVYEVGDD